MADLTAGQDLEALQARLRTLQAEIAAELQHAAAAEAVVAASHAAVTEAELSRAAPPASLRAAQRWALGLGAGLVLVASVLTGLGIRQARLVEALQVAGVAHRQRHPVAERALIDLERHLSQVRLSARPCASGHGQAGSSPEGSRSVSTPSGR